MTPFEQSYCIISLTQGQVAKVDRQDFERVSAIRWYAQWEPDMKVFYAVNRGPKIGGKQPSATRMHRLVLGIERGDKRHVDHINHDTLDNRRENLRIASVAENSWNQKTPKNNKSGFRGVFQSRNSFRASIMFNGKRIYLGTRKTAELAYRELYVPAAIHYYGEFAMVEGK